MQSTKTEFYETLTAAGDWASMCVCVCVCTLVAQSCPTLCHPMDCSPQGSSVHGDSPGKNTGVGGHAFLPPKVYIVECSGYDAENGGFRDSGGGVACEAWRASPPTHQPAFSIVAIHSRNQTRTLSHSSCKAAP